MDELQCFLALRRLDAQFGVIPQHGPPGAQCRLQFGSPTTSGVWKRFSTAYTFSSLSVDGDTLADIKRQDALMVIMNDGHPHQAPATT